MRSRERGGRNRRLPRAAPISEYTRIRVSDAIDRPVFDVLHIASIHDHLAIGRGAPPLRGNHPLVRGDRLLKTRLSKYEPRK